MVRALVENKKRLLRNITNIGEDSSYSMQVRVLEHTYRSIDLVVVQMLRSCRRSNGQSDMIDRSFILEQSCILTKAVNETRDR